MTKTMKLDPFTYFMPAGSVKGDHKYWTKRVTGIDKTQKGAFRILGDFMRKGEQEYLADAVYLFCDGKPDWKKKQYALFMISEMRDGGGPSTVVVLEASPGVGWLEKIEPVLDRALNAYPPESATTPQAKQGQKYPEYDLADYSDEDIISEVFRRRLEIIVTEKIFVDLIEPQTS